MTCLLSGHKIMNSATVEPGLFKLESNMLCQCCCISQHYEWDCFANTKLLPHHNLYNFSHLWVLQVNPCLFAPSQDLLTCCFLHVQVVFSYFQKVYVVQHTWCCGTHMCVSLFGENLSLISRCRWMARCGTLMIGRLTWTRWCSSLSPLCEFKTRYER